MTPDVKTEIISQGHDFSAFGLFFQADPIVKGVMILLLLLSIWCWAIIINKSLALKKEKKLHQEFEELFWSGTDLQNLYQEVKSNCEDSFSFIFLSGMNELNKSEISLSDRQLTNVSLRIQSAIHIAIHKEVEKFEQGMTVLASIGSIAPFIGLFGTVWGIVNAFQSIAISNNTSLAVVAPGIAEALFATALGLIAAIPAVWAYNKFSNDLEKLSNRLDFFGIEFGSVLIRKMEKN